MHYPPTHGLRTPNEAFFHWNPELLGLGRQIGQINSGAFGVFSAELSAPILVQWVPCPCFPLFNHYFYKKLILYIHIPNIYLVIGFEFGPQTIRNLVFVCPYSVGSKSDVLHLNLIWRDNSAWVDINLRKTYLNRRSIRIHKVFYPNARC